MPKKCMKPAKGVRSVPQIGNRCSRVDSQSSSSSSVSTRSSSSTIKQLKKAELAKKKAVENASSSGGEQTKPVPQHLVSHMLPFFYPNDYEQEPTDDNDTSVEVPRHLVSHVTAYCYPVTGTADNDVHSPRPDTVPRHLESHVTRYCYPVTGTADNEDVRSPRPDTIPRHLESHVAPYCQPVNDDGDIIQWPTDANVENSAVHTNPAKAQRTNYVPRHLQSHLFDSDNGEAERRTGICCLMTREHANMRDTLFADDDKPVRRVGGRRHVVTRCNLFEESKPKPRPMSISIVQRAPENTKENIFGSEQLITSPSRRRWENDTKSTIFGSEACVEQTPTQTPRSCRYEDTKEKLFGERYGVRKAEEEQARRRRPLREDTQETLFGPPMTPTPQRPQSARSFTTTHENLFGQTPPQSGRRLMHRENTFDNLFGASQHRPVVAPGADERYTAKNPKIIHVSSHQKNNVAVTIFFVVVVSYGTVASPSNDLYRWHISCVDRKQREFNIN